MQPANNPSHQQGCVNTHGWVFTHPEFSVSPLNVYVTFFDSITSTHEPKAVHLYKILRCTDYISQVEQIRNEPDVDRQKSLKKTMPVFTPGGIFLDRTVDSMHSASGFMVVDIDAQDNTHISNFQDLKKHLSKFEQIAYIGHSLRGKGLLVLVYIKYPQNYRQQFDYFADLLGRYDIRVDRAQASIASPRYVSYDPDPYINLFPKCLIRCKWPEVKGAHFSTHFPHVQIV